MSLLKLFKHQEEALNETRDRNRCVPLPGYRGLYEIDITGTIYSVSTTNSRRKRVIKPFMNSSGYLRVNLYDSKGKSRKHYVHRLVAFTFISNPNNLPIVNHKDCNKLNNNVDNLEWCTQKENIKHSIENGLQRNVEVEIYDVTSDEKYIFQSMRKASEFLGRCPNYISLHLKKDESFAHGKYLVTRLRKKVI